jgi:hypothetical protein
VLTLDRNPFTQARLARSRPENLPMEVLQQRAWMPRLALLMDY